MREIKFRAWDKVDKKIRKVMSLDFYNTRQSEVTLSNDGDIYLRFFEQIELMQNTGLKDKNGKEIYEGDIVTFTYAGEPKKRNKKYELKTSKEKVGVIIYDNCECCYYIEFLSLWKGMYDVELYKDLTYKNIRDVDDLEVIGNTCENSELLEQIT